MYACIDFNLLTKSSVTLLNKQTIETMSNPGSIHILTYHILTNNTPEEDILKTNNTKYTFSSDNFLSNQHFILIKLKNTSLKK